ncbi:TetR/AcrR family transcriptional regulator [Candidatus Microthrix sp.]|uniref:TetR/AcrR family transcriptional regulator n=1 Tax=Candidatus Neomicrothrix sp. TaxID=2719034 RepID=UPI002591B037|nr:TetR/AcrR family transcriptional regulator [Candidatus Microthrix sp.]HMS48663.1 helix-turn-helix domain-containing protein [Candidatus Microthrix sp.]
MAPIDTTTGIPGEGGTSPLPESAGATKARTPLTLDRIVRTAIDLIESEGPDALSMRRLATRLGSSPMATYHHVADRTALLEAIALHVITELTTESVEADDPPQPRLEPDWAEVIRATAKGALVLSRRYPATFAALLRWRPTALVSGVLGVSSNLVAGGLDEASARMAVRTVTRYMMGTVMGEGASASTGLSREELDESFEFGIEALLDGMARRLA